MTEISQHIKSEIKRFKRKYLLKLLLRGIIFFLSLIIATFLLFSGIESIAYLSTDVRLILLISFLLIFAFSLVYWVVIPLRKIIVTDKVLSDEQAAAEIGRLIPNVSDKLLNVVQLIATSHSSNDLIYASIEEKSKSFEHINFAKSVSYKDVNKSLIKYLLLPLLFFIGLVILFPINILQSTERIVNYSTNYSPPAPFEFKFIGDLNSYKSEPYTAKLTITGDKIPSTVNILANGIKRSMIKLDDGSFSYTIDRLTDKTNLQFYAAGFYSNEYIINVISRPSFNRMNTLINYPPYTKFEDETIDKITSLQVPEGTELNWLIEAENAEEIRVKINDTVNMAYTVKNESFTLSRSLIQSESHVLSAINKDASIKNPLVYSIEVIPDAYPKINFKTHEDSVLYQYLFVEGKIIDDYGFTRMQFNYRTVSDADSSKPFKSRAISISRDLSLQNFAFQFNLDSIEIRNGQNLQYYLSVWDNDGIHGAKRTNTDRYTLTIPTNDEVNSKISEEQSKNANTLENALNKAQEVKKELKELSKKLKSKKELNWQDKKEVEKLLQKHQSLQQDLEQVQRNIERNQQKEERFNEFSESIQEKTRQLQKLMKEMLNDETREMMQQLQEMLQENMKSEDLSKMLEQLNEQDEDMENELDRSIEMYKQLKFDRDFEKTKQKLEELAKKQEELSELSKDKSIDEDVLKKEQEFLNEEFEQLKEKMDALQDQAKELDKDISLDKTEQMQQDIEQKMKESAGSLEKNKRNQASEKQKQASDQMKEMAQQMAQMQQSEQMEQAQEDMDNLRQILENLVTLSFSQEKLVKDFSRVRRTDPKYVELSQQQLKLYDDSEIIEDSLLALAKRVFQIESFVTREVTDMKDHMEKAMELLRDRKPQGYVTKEQHYAITSMNNLALLLSDIMEQMQEQMAKQMQGDQMCNKPGGKNPKPGAGEMQKQLNEMMQQLKNGQKQGRELSKQLAKIAAQQQRIRNAMKEMEGKEGNKGKQIGDQLKKLEELMNETEKDLLYKNLTEKTIERNKEILTRLLEAEQATQERDLDDKREAQKAEQLSNNPPPALEEYLREKQRQVELLQTIPPNLRPYYKKKVDDYFNNIEN